MANKSPSRTFRLCAPKPLESALQSQIMDYLAMEQARGRVIWFCRVNGGLARYGKCTVKNYLLHLPGAAAMGKGYSDLHGMLKGGRYFALEVKRHGESPTPEQRDFLKSVTDGGGIAAVVHDFNEARDAISEVGNS